MNKFVGLWRKGNQARLLFETELGKVLSTFVQTCYDTIMRGTVVLVDHVFGIEKEELLPDSR